MTTPAFPLSPSDARIAARQDEHELQSLSRSFAHDQGLKCFCRSCDNARLLQEAARVHGATEIGTP